MARWSWLVALVGIVAAFAFASDGSAYVNSSSVSLTATGPTPTMMKMRAGTYLAFVNKDSVTHMVVFANGLCSLSVSPGEASDPPWRTAHAPRSSPVGQHGHPVDDQGSLPCHRSRTPGGPALQDHRHSRPSTG
jgi:plastocyanin